MKGIRVGFIPWWTENPYQLQLREELRKSGHRVIGNPPLSIVKLLLGRDGLDVIHIHWFHAMYSSNYLKMPYAMLILLLYRLIKNNIVWTVHELDFYESCHPKADALFVRFLMKLSRVLLVHSEYSRLEILRRFPYKGEIFTMRHAAYSDIYPQEHTQSSARQQLNIKDGQRVFLYFGYIKPYKGVEELIDCFTKSSSHKDVLLIAGNPLDASTKEDIHQRAIKHPRIHLTLGYIPDAMVEVYLKSADIVVFPFKHTHTSGSLLLALAFGKPVIAPKIASIPEYVDTSNAIFFDPDNANGLSNAIAEATQRDLNTMAHHAALCSAELSWSKMARVHSNAYEMITST